MVSVLVPIGYLLFIVGSLSLFSRRYRAKTRAAKRAWFPRHEERDLYVSLLSHFTKDKPDAPLQPNPYLTGALMRRAIVDVRRMNELRDAKQALTILLAKGQIGDEIWNQLLDAEKEMEAEALEVVQEANVYRMGWGQSIFPHAADMVQHGVYKKAFEQIEAEREKEAERAKTRATLKSNDLLDPGPVLTLAAFQPLLDRPKASEPITKSASQTSRPATPSPLGPGKAGQPTVSGPPSRAPTPSKQDHVLKPPAPATVNGSGAASLSADSSDDEAPASAPKSDGPHAGHPHKKKKKGKKRK